MRMKKEIGVLYDSVARQHGLFVKLLPSPIAEYSIDAYLLYRIVDTVEDSHIDFNIKSALLDEMSKDLLSGIKHAAAQLQNCSEIAPVYQNLLAAANLILEFHSSLDEKAQSSIEKTGRTMASGMLKYIENFHQASSSDFRYFLFNLEDLDLYCYSVAGCVGVLHMEFFIRRQIDSDSIPKDFSLRVGALLKQGKELGIYLQLVNIIRDRSDDMTSRDKTYIPKSLQHLSESEQIEELIRFARLKEPVIEAHLTSFTDSVAINYCQTLYRVAKVHFDFYEHASSSERNKPSALKIFAVLPLKLKWHFISYKVKKIFSSPR